MCEFKGFIILNLYYISVLIYLWKINYITYTGSGNNTWNRGILFPDETFGKTFRVCVSIGMQSQ